MTRLKWGDPEDRRYKYGIDRGVLYVDGQDGVPWNGLVSFERAFGGGGIQSYYFDGTKISDIGGLTDFEATLTAYSSPEEFDQCDGTDALAPGFYVEQQRGKPFAFVYREMIGDAAAGKTAGYFLRFVYNATASATKSGAKTAEVNASADNLSWLIRARPDSVLGRAPSASFYINSTEIDPEKMALIEDALYGTESTPPRILYPTEILSILEMNIHLIVTDNLDGTATIEGGAPFLNDITEHTFELTAPTLVELEGVFGAYSVTSV